MNQNRLRFGIAVLCSALCYGATIWIYDRTAAPSHVGDRDPIAYVVRVDNEVERRPIKRTIWQELEGSDPVYAGEAIRTTKQGQAKLQFKGNAKTLDIEPESLIVLSQAEGNISLELLDGSIFVAQTDGQPQDATSEQKLTLKSEAGEVDLSKATAAVSKQTGKSVDLQVIKGSAVLKNGDTSQSLKSGETNSLGTNGATAEAPMIQATSPRSDSPVYVSLQNPTPLKFSYNTDLASNATPPIMELWIGPSRRQLARAETQTSSQPQTLQKLVKPGRYFWKWIARSSKDSKQLLAESSLQRLEVKALAAPLTLQPANKEFMTLQSEGLPTSFQWSAPERASEVTLQIGSDPNFRDLLFTEKFPASTNQVDRILPNGKYHWRVSAYYPDEHEMIAAAAQSFEVWVKPPKVIQIAWTIKKTLYYPLAPKAELTWTATEDPDIQKWRVKLVREEGANQNAIELESKDKTVVSPLPGPGRWIASVEALDPRGQVIARSDSRNFELAILPPSPAPEVLPEGTDLKANQRGDIKLNWRGPAGATAYDLTLKSEDGKEILSQSTKQPTAFLKSLLPGRYDLELIATDQFGRPSEKSAPRKLIVPDGSGLSAPKVKRIQVN